MNYQHRWLRLAIKIHEQLAAQSRQLPVITLSDVLWQRAHWLLGRQQRAQRKGWQLAALHIGRELRRVLNTLQREIDDACVLLEGDPDHNKPASVQDIYRDLLSLANEFDEVDSCTRAGVISVCTERIVLEGIDLGPLKIELDWTELGQQSPYRIIALDANPACTNESVTHPHVQDERLCEGDGHWAIHAALASGRIADFFLVVASLLRTYNAGSPFVSLERWHGYQCQDCGDHLTEDERLGCGQCGDPICGDCYVGCTACEEPYCSRCISLCGSCEQACCRGCLSPCVQCRTRVCPDCLLEDERCPTCDEQKTEEEVQQESADQVSTAAGSAFQAAPARLALQSPGLGQAVAAAGSR